MQCTGCGGANPEGARFCVQCGTALARACPACGAAVAGAQKFCASCGRALAVAVAAAPQPAPVPADDGERRQATVVFSDLTGYTALTERLDPEEISEIMSRVKREAATLVEQHGGTVNQFVGDEVIGIFVPSMAGATHAGRAVAAAAALLRATGHGDAGGPWVPVGAGVGTGIAYVGSIGEGPDTELTAMGDIVNTTARLASAAGAGEILVTAAAAAAAGLPAGLERRSLELKGKSGPTEVVVHTV